MSALTYITDIGYTLNCQRRNGIAGNVLTRYSISVTRKAMGRPPLDVKPTLVRLTKDACDRIDALEGPNRRAVFIRAAVARELQRRERERAKKDEG